MRGQSLTRRLLHYARRVEPTSVLLDPQSCVRDVTNMLRRLMDSRTTIEFVDGQNDVGTVRIDPAQLE